MQDSEDRPQRRSALVARELARLYIDIAALSEARYAEQGSLREDGAGYTLFWSGRNKHERRFSGVGFMIKTSIDRKLQNLPVLFKPHHVPKTPNPEQQVCHCPQCLRTYSAG